MSTLKRACPPGEELPVKPTIEFIHWGHQCPWCELSMETLGRHADAGEIRCRFENVDGARAHARLISSFMTVAAGHPGTGSPVMERNWRALFDETIPQPAPADLEKPQAALDCIKELDGDTILDSIAVCANHAKGKSLKEDWYADRRGSYFGFVGYRDGTPVCMLEFTGSLDCPYGAIGKSADTAQIICVYSNDEARDYTLDILGHAEKSLAGRYKSVQVIAGARTKYPNGTKALFESAGYLAAEKLPAQYLLGKGFDDVYLMRKDLA